MPNNNKNSSWAVCFCLIFIDFIIALLGIYANLDLGNLGVYFKSGEIVYDNFAAQITGLP